MKRILTLLSLLALLTTSALAQQSTDFKTVEGTIHTLYSVISGEPGQARNWDQFRSLFKPESRLIPTRKENDVLTLKALTPEEYIELFSSRVKTGFFEKELHHVVESYGTIVHVFSTYETREKKDGPVTNRGINSIQLFYDGTRYYVINIFWCAESMGFPLPSKYIK